MSEQAVEDPYADIMARVSSSAGSVSSSGLPDTPVRGGLDASASLSGLSRDTLTPVDRVREWLGRYIITIDDADLDVLTLWAAHTWLVWEIYTTPRLVIDSPVPGSGKTTVLEHLSHLCLGPLQAASLSSPALLTRLLAVGPRTVLIDEADRNLNPKRDGVEDLLAVINAGYKRGATRPVLVPTKDGWQAQEMPTYAAIAMAGNAPQLPDDTQSRSIRILLMPDVQDVAEPSDWEYIEADADGLGESLKVWAESVKDTVKASLPELPAGCTGRIKERWSPLARVADAAGGRWPCVVTQLIQRDLDAMAADREDGIMRVSRPMQLLADLREIFDNNQCDFIPTSELVESLQHLNPSYWGPEPPLRRALTAQGMGRILARSFRINSIRPPQGDRTRGYTRQSFEPVWR